MPRSTIAVATAAVEIKLAALPPGVTVRLDDNPTASTVTVPCGPAQDRARCRRRATAVVHVTLRRAPYSSLHA